MLTTSTFLYSSINMLYQSNNLPDIRALSHNDVVPTHGRLSLSRSLWVPATRARTTHTEEGGMQYGEVDAIPNRFGREIGEVLSVNYGRVLGVNNTWWKDR